MAGRQRRLVSLGVQQLFLEGFGSRRRPELVDVEYFFDRDHPSRYYRRQLPHGTLEALTETSGTESVERLGAVSVDALRGWRSGVFPDARPDETRPAS